MVYILQGFMCWNVVPMPQYYEAMESLRGEAQLKVVRDQCSSLQNGLLESKATPQTLPLLHVAGSLSVPPSC